MRVNFVQLNGMLLSHEHWSQSISAVGATPANYLALAGCCTERTVKWNGVEFDSQHLMCGFDAVETEFVSPVNSDHWVILVPKDLINSHLGEESAADLLRNKLLLDCAPRQGRQLMTLVDRGLGQLPGGRKEQVDNQMRTAIQSELLDIITEILLLNDMSCSTAPLNRPDVISPLRPSINGNWTRGFQRSRPRSYWLENLHASPSRS